MSTRPVKRALLSVFDKRGIGDFALQLAERGVQILSTGGTAKLLKAAGIAVTDVSEYTGFPEIMAGRVKTLHPKVHGGLLGRRGTDDAVMAEHGISEIDLLVVNLYPFVETISNPDASRSDCVEMIDIGGPAMLRAAAQNHADVTVLTDPDDYASVLQELDSKGGTQLATRQRLAAKTFALTAAYDGHVASYLASDGATDRANDLANIDEPATEPGSLNDLLPQHITLPLTRLQTLRYGENPHQLAAFYRIGGQRPGTIAGSRQLQGKPLSYNNIADAASALACVAGIEQPACVIVKHANPCGVAVADTIVAAYDVAFAADPESAFGGIIAFNRPIDGETAATIVARQFAEVIVAPEVDEQAAAAFSAKTNLRVLASGPVSCSLDPLQYQWVDGGMLVQQPDHAGVSDAQFRVVSERAPTESEMRDLRFAWHVVKYVKSNAIVYAKDGHTLGIGPGQTSRVMSARIAVQKAKAVEFELNGSAIASDAFFPFRDGIDAAAAAGASAVVQPGGSMRDQEVIDATNEHGMAMVFTGIRHFRH